MTGAAHFADAPVEVRVPGDKSISHRALMFAGAARGESRLRGVLTGADCRSTAAILRALRVEVGNLGDGSGEVFVRSAGFDGWRQPDRVLDCGNSGTTARLMLGLVAGRSFAADFTGDASLRTRPMARVTGPLGAMGASFEFQSAPGRLPLRVRGGALRALEYRSPHASAQVKSAILLAGMVGGVPVRVSEPALSRDHTERMLRSVGARVETGTDREGPWVASEPLREALPPLDMVVPGDPSSAAFLLALAALAGGRTVRVPDVCVNPTRAGFIDVMRRMGVGIRIEAAREDHGEPVADLLAAPARLRAASLGAADVAACIDEIPILAVLAARAEGVTRITGAAELRVKESDRIAALVSNLRAIGVRADELPDGLEVEGTDVPLAGRVVTHHDHRIAMAFGVLGALPGNRIEIDDRACVDVSFPGFWETIRMVSAA